MNRYKIFVPALLGLSLLLAWAIQNNWRQNVALAQQHFIDEGHDVALSGTNRLEIAIRSIYENIRTLSLLPNVRAIDRHGENLSSEGRITFQQIYNNLANDVAVSEVYVVPIDFNPDRIDPVLLKPEEPIAMFDQLITGKANFSMNPHSFAVPREFSPEPKGDLPEVEIYEYRQLVQHAAWLKSHFPTAASIEGLNLPFVSGSEIITCDNTHYSKSLDDADRSGVMFSVPFYGPDGDIKGMITAIILTNALRDLLPNDNMALVNPGNNYVVAAPGVEKMSGSAVAVARAKPDPKLIYSEVLDFPVKDYRNPWQVWAGLPNSAFYSSDDYLAANSTRNTQFFLLAVSVLVVGLCFALMARNANQARALTETMRKARDIAQKSEAEAQASAETFKVLNDDISRLNRELAQRLQELTEAQENIVKKGQMAQLGHLVATVAHELRNPLTSVSTTAFTLRRKLKNLPVDVETQLQRIEHGVTRCDGIITQLLDFSRSQPVNSALADIVAWLAEVLQEEAMRLPSTIALRLVAPQNQIMVAFDPERLRRGVINLIANAAEAMTSGDGPAKTRGEPTVSVSLRQSRGRVEIIVSDNGPGMSPEILEKIGEPLFTTKSFGTGLGVAAVRKVAELHGGGLEVRSKPDEGSSFIIWIPQAAATALSA